MAAYKRKKYRAGMTGYLQAALCWPLAYAAGLSVTLHMRQEANHSKSGYGMGKKHYLDVV
jgi:hypothetical protein